jgi:hypothetical protein
MIAVAKMRAQTRVIFKVCADKSRQDLLEREMMTFLTAPFSRKPGWEGPKASQASAESAKVWAAEVEVVS